MKDTESFYARNIPAGTKALFKSWCAVHGYTMESAVAALMAKAVADDIPLPKARRKGARR